MHAYACVCGRVLSDFRCTSFCLSAQVCLCMPIPGRVGPHLWVSLPMCFPPLDVPVCGSTCLWVRLSVALPVSGCTCLWAHLFLGVPICASACPWVCLPVGQPAPGCACLLGLPVPGCPCLWVCLSLGAPSVSLSVTGPPELCPNPDSATVSSWSTEITRKLRPMRR